jgi:hypothetical protein
MEDLEQLHHEKESLLQEKRLAELKCNDMSEQSALQMREYEEIKANYQKQLRNLEVGIKLKQVGVSLV